MDTSKPHVDRLSISLPAALSKAFDQMIEERGFTNRSQAMANMVQQEIQHHQEKDSETIMVGTVTMFYDAEKPGLLERLARIERDHIEECITSQHILLEDGFMMEVVLVQGPVKTLREIADQMISCKGIQSGNLALYRKIIPQVHTRNL